MNASGLKAKNITMVLTLLSVYDTISSPLHQVQHHVRVDLEDDLDAPLFSQLPFLVDCINQFLANNDQGNILVHCRPWVDPNPHFRQDLALFHSVLSHSSVASADLASRSLPQLHFHSSFVHPISVDQTKTLTIRLESDPKHDDTTSLLAASMFPFSTVVAVTNATNTPFAYLFVTAIEHINIQDLTLDHANGEGLPTLADLHATLHRFYTPDKLEPGTRCLVLHFRLVAAAVGQGASI
ncbi:hypothetical protein DYB34_003045 [Aphanomyces astaci]|uniref:ASCH domain-containing protein n=1 Tax=Aphanomyces astaci TaxID=112090 RepID=A0A418C980_APHAT|nr:hypothetical protein DYB34_003045 [Aphanomyces astaci]